MASDKPGKGRVVIAGAGFGGLWAARRLAGSGHDVLVVDRRNYHTFVPLLYQVAAAELEPGQIAYPVRGVFRRKRDIRFAMAEVTGIDKERKLLLTGGPAIPYDCLILSLGSETNFFGVPGAEENCFGLKALEEGIALRNHIIGLFEQASQEKDPGRQRELLTFTVAGGGPTGVEYAGALAELIRGPLAKDYPLLNLSQARVVLLEAGQSILTAFPEELREYALYKLGRKGVEVHLGAQVSRVTPEAVLMEDGSALATRTVVWTAGVRGTSMASDLGLDVGPAGRVPVGETLQTRNEPSIFVIGDMAHFEGPGGPLPMLAPVAMQQGKLAADNARRFLAGKKLKPFKYLDKGIMATIGRAAAVTAFGRLRFTGFTAWAAWLFIHLIMLIGFRNRLAVMLNWAWDYFLFERSVRLVIPQAPKPGKARECKDGDRLRS
ncbi:MAG: NAD(P)/FAD-dependent oxidoreductase [Thermodesulfobacteriota bacterium]